MQSVHLLLAVHPFKNCVSFKQTNALSKLCPGNYVKVQCNNNTLLTSKQGFLPAPGVVDCVKGW